MENPSEYIRYLEKTLRNLRSGKARIDTRSGKTQVWTTISPKPKRKLSAWNKFVKANSNKKKFQYANGKLKLKKMGIAYRKRR